MTDFLSRNEFAVYFSSHKDTSSRSLFLVCRSSVILSEDFKLLFQLLTK